MVAPLSVRDWEAAIKAVEGLATSRVASQGSSSSSSTVSAFHHVCKPIYAATRVAISPNAWQNLLAAKVPYRVVKACCSVLSSSAGPDTPIDGRNSTTGGSSSTSSSAVGAAASNGQALHLTHLLTAADLANHPTAHAVAVLLCILAERAHQDGIAKPSQQQPANQQQEQEQEQQQQQQQQQSHGVSNPQSGSPFGQQLQQSGFLQLLPRLLEDAAQAQTTAGLTAEVTGCNAGAGRTAASTSLSAAAAPNADGLLVEHSNSSSSSRAHSAVSNGLWVLLKLYALIGGCWPVGAFATEVAPRCTRPVMQLALLALQSCCHRAPVTGAQLPAVAEAEAAAADTILCTWDAAFEAVVVVMQAISRGDPCCSPASLQQHEEELLQCSAALPCLALLMATAVYRLLLSTAKQLPEPLPQQSSAGASSRGDSSSTSSSSSSSSSGGGGGGGGSDRGRGSGGRQLPAEALMGGEAAASMQAAARTATQVASQQQARVPLLHQQLLHGLGCSSTALLWCAALACPHLSLVGPIQTAEADVRLMEVAYQGLVLAGFRRSSRDKSSAKHIDGSRPDSWRDRHQQEQHLLPIVLLLYLAAHRPAQLSTGQPANCVSTVNCAALAVGSSRPAEWPQPLRQSVLQEVQPLALQIGDRTLAAAGCHGSGSPADGSRSCSAHAANAFSRCPPFTALNLLIAMWDAAGGRSTCQDPAALGQDCALQLCQLLEVATRGDWQQAEMTGTHLAWLTDRLLNSRQLLRSATAWWLQPSAATSVSADYVQLVSLCSSILKRAAMNDPLFVVEWPLDCCVTVSAAAAEMCHLAAEQLSHGSGDGSSSSSSSGGGGGGGDSPCIEGSSAALPLKSTAATAAAGAAAAAAAVAASVSWLAVCGRGLQLIAEFLLTYSFVDASAASSGIRSADASAAAEVGRIVMACSAVISKLLGSLQDPGVALQLAAAGYETSDMVQQAHAASAELASPSAPALPAALPAALRSLGLALTSLAFPCACNNLACSNLSGPRELQLVNGRRCRCSGCKAARYCGKACQVAHWKAHKRVCKALKAAQAGARPGVEPVVAAAAAATS